MTDHELMEAFEAGRMPSQGFPHATHVRVGWIYLRREPFDVALRRFSAALRQFAAAQGNPDRYHETITVAYMALIRDRLSRTVTADWDGFAAENADLLRWRPSVLDVHYSPEVLWCDRARACFLLPDRMPLPSPRPDGGSKGGGEGPLGSRGVP